MKRLVGSVMLTAMIVSPMGCKDRGEPQPRYNRVITAERDGEALPPVPLEHGAVEGLPPASPTRFLPNIAKPVSGTIEDLPDIAFTRSKAVGGSAKAAVAAPAKLNDDTVQALTQQFVAFMKEGNLAGVAEMAIPDQAPLAAALAKGAIEIAPAIAQLREEIGDRDAATVTALEPDKDGMITIPSPPGGGKDIQLPVAFRPLTDAPSAVASVEVDSVDPSLAYAKLSVGANGGGEGELELEKADGRWRIYFSNLPEPDDVKAFAATVNRAPAAIAAVSKALAADEIKPSAVLETLYKRLTAPPEAGGGA